MPIFAFHIEEWVDECDFSYFGHDYQYEYGSQDIFACAASNAIKAKFRFPSKDPEENSVIDQRSDVQKVNDILRVWSQILTPGEQKVWDEIAERNLSHDISLNGIRTPKTFIDQEIKKYRQLSATKQKRLLMALDPAPDTVTPLSTEESETPSCDHAPLSIMPGEFQVDESLMAHYCKLSPPDPACSPHTCTHKSAPAEIEHLLVECHNEVLRIRNYPVPMKLSSICRKNKQLLFKFLFILKTQFSLSPRLKSMYNKLSMSHKINETLSSRALKKICSALQTRKLIQDEWLNKPFEDVQVHFAHQAPVIKICLNSSHQTAIVDTGSTYSLVPFVVWQSLKLNQNTLDSSIQYNINSASHTNKDAVLGRIDLQISIFNYEGVEQSVTQTCLILRPQLDLHVVLLGNDFLKANSVIISYSKIDPHPIILINNEKIPLLTDQFTPHSHLVSSFLSIPATKGRKAATFTTPNFTEQTSILNSQCPIITGKTNHSVVSNFSDQTSSMSSDCPTPGQLFHLDPDTNIQNITSFLQECKLAKYKHSNLQEEINSYSMQPLSLDDMIQANFEKKSIIPEVGPKDPTPDISHLSPEIQGRLKIIFAKHQKLFSRSKHHLGRFTGFEATANIDKNSPINCRQGARNKVLPPSCKQDLQKYKTSGLFELSTGLADDYCANITLVLRNQIKEQRDNTKAGKYVMRQENKKKLSPSKVETKQLDLVLLTLRGHYTE